MEKADLLEELKSKIGLICENIEDKTNMYDDLMHTLKINVPHYKTVALFLANESSFDYYNHEGEFLSELEYHIPFGESYLSIVASRGEISCEFYPYGQYIYIPFYKGHFLLGEMVIKTTQFVDDDELTFIKYIQNVLSESLA